MTTIANDAAAVIAALEYYTESTYVTNWGMQEEADNGESRSHRLRRNPRPP